jgi:chorismate-pyruvate lyase
MQKANRRRRCAKVERLHLTLYELELLRDGVTEVVAEARAEVRVSIAELRIAQANNEKTKLLDLPRLPRPHMN